MQENKGKYCSRKIFAVERYLQQKQHKTLFYRRVGEGLRHYMMKMVPDQMVPDGE